MDYPRSKRKPLTVPLLLLSVMVLAAGVLTLTKMDFSTWRVDREQVRIGTVRYGNLDITIAAEGVLQSREVELITSRVEGTVALLQVKPGDAVHRGQVLAVLHNPALQNGVDIAGYALEGARAEALSTSISVENQLLNQQSALMQLRFSLEKARLELEAKRRLSVSNIISRIEFQQSELDVRQIEEMTRIEEERLAKAQANKHSQIEVFNAQVRQAEQSLARALADLAGLEIRADMTGVVQEVSVDFGQRLRAGDQVGRLARQDLLYAELKVPSRQAVDLAFGQRVEIDTRNGILVGQTSRIDPAVIDGSVVVDVEIISPLPASLRPELRVEGTIYVAEIKDGLYVQKPAYSRSQSRQTVYVLEPDGKYASRRVIETGRVSVSYIEVLGGLEEGERLILSEPEAWQDHDRILLN